jgi:NAD(P)-dependent dehydrogenase (short-subunit alcohol dehydrogenase family)
VTGGGSGIGLMAAQSLAANGARVYIVGRRLAALENAVKAHRASLAGELIPLVADVASKESIEALVKEIGSREKCLCILINNAGLQEKSSALGDSRLKGSSSSPSITAEELKERFFDDDIHTFEDWERVYRVNASALFFMSMAFMPLLQKAHEHFPGFSASVINISSITGLTRFSYDTFAYNTSKGAAVHLTKMLSSEVATARLKVRVNSIAPGVFPSEMQTGEAKEDGKSVVKDENYGSLPAQRMGNEQDVAAAVLFAATCQYLYGQVIAVDGGFLLRGDRGFQ